MAKLYYTNKELPQRSEKWLEMRKSCIGGSDLGAILGLTAKYTTPKQWWKRRLGKIKAKKVTPGMERGAFMEEEAGEAIKTYLKEVEGIKNPKLVQYFAKHPKIPYIGVSFDGVDTKNKFITEIKCPLNSWNFRSVFENGIQDYYYPQIQAQLAVAKEIWGIDKAYFCSYFPDGIYLLDNINFIERFKTLAVIDFEFDPDYFEAVRKVAEVMWKFLALGEWNDEEYNEVLKEFNEFTI